jgi:hypothetical protein
MKRSAERVKIAVERRVGPDGDGCSSHAAFWPPSGAGELRNRTWQAALQQWLLPNGEGHSQDASWLCPQCARSDSADQCSCFPCKAAVGSYYRRFEHMGEREGPRLEARGPLRTPASRRGHLRRHRGLNHFYRTRRAEALPSSCTS